jgi:hypothetical protein
MGELILIAGLLHFALLPVSAAVPRVLNLRRELGGLSPLARKMVWVHGAFIFGTILAFGVLTLAGRHEMTAGTGLGPPLAATIGLFWLARLMVQLFYYHPREWPRGAWIALGRHGLTALFAFWSIVYLWAFAAAR